MHLHSVGVSYSNVTMCYRTVNACPLSIPKCDYYSSCPHDYTNVIIIDMSMHVPRCFPPASTQFQANMHTPWENKNLNVKEFCIANSYRNILKGGRSITGFRKPYFFLKEPYPSVQLKGMNMYIDYRMYE